MALEIPSPEDDNTLEIPNPFPTALDAESEDAESNELAGLLKNAKVDTRELAAQQGEMYLERGDYLWDMPTLVVRVGSNDMDKDPADTFQRMNIDKGRCMVNVYGVVKPRDPKGRGGRFQFSFSPDKRYRRDQDGNLVEPAEQDMFSKQYTQLTEYFFQTHERQIRDVGEIIDLVKSGLYYMYVTKSKNGGNYFGGIKSLKAK